MTYSSTLTKTSQITIPKHVRNALSIEPGERIIFKIVKDTVTIEREQTAAEIASKIDSLIPPSAREHHTKHFSGLTAAAAQEKWLDTPDARAYFQAEQDKTL